MKIIITGSLGHISKPLTEELVQKGHAVTVISSKTEKQKDIETLGATAAIGSLEDIDFLTKTFSGADAVYCMIPPNGYFNHDFDLMAYYSRLGNNYAQAIQRTGVKRVIHLSSIGAHLAKDSGIILGHHAVEEIFKQVPGIDVTYMRPLYFYYNLLGFVNMIRNQGIMAANYGSDDKIVMVSPIDIAAAVAEEIVRPSAGNKVRYVASDERTANEIASILGAAIGKPDLKWIIIPSEQMRKGLETIGMSPRIAASLIEMYESMKAGPLMEDYYRHIPAMGKVKIEDYATEFANAFK